MRITITNDDGSTEETLMESLDKTNTDAYLAKQQQ